MMKNKALKILLIFSITFSFAQDYTPLNLSIKGMHCAGGCAKMIENSLNQNEGISAAVNFNTSSASIIYDKNIVSEVAIIDMINGYRSGKFVATNQNQLKAQLQKIVVQKEKIAAKKQELQTHLVQALKHPQKKFFKGKEVKTNRLLE